MSVAHFGPEAATQTDKPGEGLKRARLDGDERTVQVALEHQLYLEERIMELERERDSLSVALALQFSDKNIVILFTNGMKCRIETQTAEARYGDIPVEDGDSAFGIHFLLSTVTRQNSTAAIQERIAPFARTDTPGRDWKNNQGIFLRFDKYFTTKYSSNERSEVLPALVAGCRLILDMFSAAGIQFAGTEDQYREKSTSTAELDIEMLRLLGGDVLPQ